MKYLLSFLAFPGLGEKLLEHETSIQFLLISQIRVSIFFYIYSLQGTHYVYLSILPVLYI